MAKLSKPGKETVALPSEPRPSRIRREPVRVDPKAQAKTRSPSRERWSAAAGVLLVALGGAALMVGLSEVTNSQGPARAAATAGAEPRFGYCYNGEGADCVIDGDSFAIAGQRVEVGGIDAPEIFGSACPEEARRGVRAAARLRQLLNSGEVTVIGTGRDMGRPLARKVLVNGTDVGAALARAGLARESGGAPKGWCPPAQG